jgi:hypothetical protein
MSSSAESNPGTGPTVSAHCSNKSHGPLGLDVWGNVSIIPANWTATPKRSSALGVRG